MINSARKSKINWTQGVAFAGSILTLLGFDLAPEQQVEAVLAIQGAQSFLTWVFRTWFTAKPL